VNPQAACAQFPGGSAWHARLMPVKPSDYNTIRYSEHIAVDLNNYNPTMRALRGGVALLRAAAAPELCSDLFCRGGGVSAVHVSLSCLHCRRPLHMSAAPSLLRCRQVGCTPSVLGGCQAPAAWR